MSPLELALYKFLTTIILLLLVVSILERSHDGSTSVPLLVFIWIPLLGMGRGMDLGPVGKDLEGRGGNRESLPVTGPPHPHFQDPTNRS